MASRMATSPAVSSFDRSSHAKLAPSGVRSLLAVRDSVADLRAFFLLRTEESSSATAFLPPAALGRFTPSLG